jgi:hypothetical protein
VLLDGKLFATDRLSEQVTSVKGKEIDAWYSGSTTGPAGTSRLSCDPTASPCGPPRPSPAMFTTSPPQVVRRPRPHPIRAQVHQVKMAEITSVV